MKNLIFSALFLLFGFSLSAQEWQGTWSSDFGELRMVQLGNKIYADYDKIGTLNGAYISSSRTFKGVFNNKKENRKGRFSFTLSRDGKSFTGKWGWGNTIPNQRWSGKQESNTMPTLTSADFQRYNRSSIGTGKECQGTWSSNIGELRMVQIRNKVYIDYSNKGYMSGTYNPSTQTLEGSFENTTTGRNGKFKFVFSRGHKTFSGKWGRHNEPLSRNWSGKRKSSRKPTLTTPRFQRFNQSGSSTTQTQQSNKKVKYEIEINVRHLVVVKENDGPGNNLELYGYVAILAGKGRESSKLIRNKYGRDQTVWEASKRRYRSKSVGEKININRKLHFDVSESDVNGTSLWISMLILDQDDVSQDDVIGREELEISVADIINTRSSVHTAARKGHLLSDNEGAVRLIYEIKAKKL